MRFMKSSALVCATLSLSLAYSAQAFAASSLCDATAGNLVSDCGFEQFSQVTNTNHVPGWTQGGDTSFTAITARNLPSYDVNSGGYALQMGNTGLGTLSQTFSDAAGGALTLSFYLEGDTPATNTFDAYLDGTQVFGVTNDLNSTSFQLFTGTTTLKATGSDTLEFTFSDSANYLSLDDVVVTEAGPASATPEPSSLMLLGTGVLGAAGMARRRFLKA